AGRDHDGIVTRAELARVDVDADVHSETELDALGLELVDAALHDRLLDLEVRHAEPDEPATGLVALEHRHCMAGARELLCAREPRGPGADHGDRAPGPRRRRLRHDPALLPRAVHDRELDLLDRDGLALPDLEHARGLARRGAEAAGEVGEVVRAVELV